MEYREEITVIVILVVACVVILYESQRTQAEIHVIKTKLEAIDNACTQMN